MPDWVNGKMIDQMPGTPIETPPGYVGDRVG